MSGYAPVRHPRSKTRLSPMESSRPKKTKLKKSEIEIAVTSDPTMWYGKQKCSATLAGTGSACTNGGYYVRNDTQHIVCGQHTGTGAYKRLREPTKEESGAAIEAVMVPQRESVEAERAKNVALGLKGKIRFTKMHMRSTPVLTPGYQAVFANYKDCNGKRGLVLSSLSPKAPRVQRHGQPGVPDGTCLENVWQGCKLFRTEVDAQNDALLPLFFARRDALCRDTKPRRHKYEDGKPFASVWIMPDGSQRRLRYAESRFIYCHFLVRDVRDLPEMKKLKDLYEGGTNVDIQGYDAYAFVDHTAEGIEASYLDESAPFGHERVLAAMLLLPETQWPWNKHRLFALPSN